MIDYEEELKETIRLGQRVQRVIKMDKPNFNYDELSDTLYISFEPGTKATGIELNNNILLRVDKDKRTVVGLTFFDYSILVQRADFGPRSFPLTGLAQMSAELRELVVEILQSVPVKNFLTLSTYTPSYAEAIPITSLQQLPAAIAA
jgi:uncharacterized protein YuzE